jgi:hypothetical protein
MKGLIGMLRDTQPLNQSKPITKALKKLARCPSCNKLSTFIEAGIQRVPPKVAKATGLPELIHQYHCDSCKSTISELDLMFK